jgi:hypothetical protein
MSIECDFLGDGRVLCLSNYTGQNIFDTRGRLITVWAECYKRISEFLTKSQIDNQACWLSENTSFAEFMVKADLAQKIDDDLYLIRGVKDRIDYLKNAKSYGQKSAETRRKKYQTSQPKPSVHDLSRDDELARRTFEGPSKDPEATLDFSRRTFEGPSTNPQPIPIPIPIPIPKKEEESPQWGIVDPPANEFLNHKFPVRKIFELWNEFSGDKLPKVNIQKIKPTSQRYVKARLRLADYPNLDEWREAIVRVSKSDFCNGNNERAWRADIDFLLRADTILKIQEGKYDNRDREKKAGIDWSQMEAKYGTGEFGNDPN